MKKDIIETLKEYPDEFELDPSLTAEAERLTEELYGKRKKRRFSWKWLSVATATAAAVVVTVLCVVLLRPQAEVPYFGEDRLYFEAVDSFDDAIAQNDLKVDYFDREYVQATNGVYYFNDSSQWAYLYQELFFVVENGFDNVNLGVAERDKQFERFKDYNYFTDKRIVNSVSVEYKIITGELSQVYSKFQKGDFIYYLEILTADTEGKIDYYVNLLFS